MSGQLVIDTNVKDNMATLTIRLPDDKHSRLKALTQSRGISVNKLME
ncbi:hypothetical protein PMG71_14090 [Roseofilum sp. BLCC_M154]|uniref:Toxin-antitoxin system HicB family antitoxin n=1 Tax=Roseofilum acuticapitatum BLCC-M154 TaxID=3022444 RepID=A0ABT7AUI7_9CYAN|nr:hypothetical protein [Roseofilum acuticapitatum]MDJ1170559.1 hypothetical protein [Roseofilum acuticapitatum BLCC-M154]